jgi:nucleoside-diphosphate-sugar epimerase
MMASFKRVLVAGGAGYIGSHVVEELLRRNYHVVVGDNFEAGDEARLNAVKDSIIIKPVDFKFREHCIKALEGVDAVINLAAKVSGVGYSSAHHSEMFTGTLQPNLNLLEAAAKKGIKNYFHMSSSCVYSDLARIPTPESLWDQHDPEQANQGYGWAKRMGEIQCRYMAREYGMKIAIGRPSNVFGGKGYSKTHVIPSILRRVFAGEDPLVVWGSGDQTRNFVHVESVAYCVVELLEKEVTDAVNIGDETQTSIKKLVTTILELTDNRPKLVFDKTKPEGTKHKALDSTLLRRLVPGFRISDDFLTGVKEMLEAFTAHERRP